MGGQTGIVIVMVCIEIACVYSSETGDIYQHHESCIECG